MFYLAPVSVGVVGSLIMGIFMFYCLFKLIGAFFSGLFGYIKSGGTVQTAHEFLTPTFNCNITLQPDLYFLEKQPNGSTICRFINSNGIKCEVITFDNIKNIIDCTYQPENENMIYTLKRSGQLFEIIDRVPQYTD